MCGSHLHVRASVPLITCQGCVSTRWIVCATGFKYNQPICTEPGHTLGGDRARDWGGSVEPVGLVVGTLFFCPDRDKKECCTKVRRVHRYRATGGCVIVIVCLFTRSCCNKKKARPVWGSCLLLQVAVI